MFVVSRVASWTFARVLISAGVLLLSMVPALAHAHEVPRHVGVRAFVAPSANTVRLLVQIPMDAVRDVEWPRRANGTLDVARAGPFLLDAARLWIADGVTLRDGDRRLAAARVVAVRASLPSDRAFDQYSSAAQAIAGIPLADSVEIAPGQLRLEAELEVPISAPVQDLVIVPQWAHLGVRTTTVLHVITPEGVDRAYSYEGDPGALRLDPRWWHAFLRFVVEGAGHLFSGIDHLLFILCLVLPVRAFRPLVGIITAFTVAHSLTLFASALGFAPDFAWFPPLVEVLIAASIVWMAVGNIVGARVEQRWKVAFVFGLIHGFGFSAALRDELQFAGAHLVTALAGFNLGIELAQLAVLAVAVPVLNRLFAGPIPERVGVIVASAFVAHEAWHWMESRFATLREYPFTWPAINDLLAGQLIRLAMAACVVTGIMWALSALMERWNSRVMARTSGNVVMLVVVLALVSGMATPRDARAQARSTATGVYTPDQAQKGREVFNASCLGCHTVASHTGPAFQLKWFGKPLADLYDYLSNLMPKSAPGSLTEDEYVWVTAYILRLNGMPPGKTELNAEPALLKALRVDSVRARTSLLQTSLHTSLHTSPSRPLTHAALEPL